jgi:hypothetical protein
MIIFRIESNIASSYNSIFLSMAKTFFLDFRMDSFVYLLLEVVSDTATAFFNLLLSLFVAPEKD